MFRDVMVGAEARGRAHVGSKREHSRNATSPQTRASFWRRMSAYSVRNNDAYMSWFDRNLTLGDRR